MCGFNPLDTIFPGSSQAADAGRNVVQQVLQQVLPKPASGPGALPAGPSKSPGDLEANAAAQALQQQTLRRRRARSLLASGAEGDPTTLTSSIPSAQAGKPTLGS